jgi:site-specific DNA-methyltransferase (cytosine-N4-specific)
MVDPRIITHPHGDRSFTSTLYYGADVRESLRLLEPQSVQCVVTSPPYWGLRSYLGEGDPLKGSEIGAEPTPESYVTAMVDVFREVRRVLRDDGVLWLNLGDSFARDGGPVTKPGATAKAGNTLANVDTREGQRASDISLKPKDLVGIPWMVAFALRADGWYLRSDVIWNKPNPMPESVTDRPTRSHEYVFLFTKNARYFYDAQAIREPIKESNTGRIATLAKDAGTVLDVNGKPLRVEREYAEIKGANRRSVWTINSRPYKGAHFATMPPALAEVCIKAGTRPGDIVLDPFSGSGTTGYVANRLGRHYVGTDLNLDYLPLAEARLTGMDPPETDEGTATEEGGPSSILDML